METFKGKTVGAVFDEIAGKYGEKEAFIFEDQRITYRELQERSNHFAKGLIALGIRKDDKVSVWMNNRPEWIYAWLASAKSGAVFVSVNSRFKIHELEYVLSQSDSSTLLFKDLVHKTNYYEMFASLCPEVKSSVPGKLSSAKFPLLKNIIGVASKPYPGFFSVEDVMALGEKKVPGRVLQERQDSIQGDDLLMIQYTSGTTSFPKGCMTAHYPALLDVLAMGKNMDIQREDRIYCPLPFYHVGGSLITFLQGLLAGATIVTTEHFEPETALRIIQEEHCTVMNGVETMWVEMLRHPRFEQYDISTLKKGWAIGPPELLRNISEKMGVRRFVNTYGLSEQTANTGTTQADDPLEFKIHWNGRPHAGTEMKIVDRETGKTLGPMQGGEICVRGFNVMKGYYKMPQETRKVIDAEGWLHTGDMGMMDEKGNFKFTGRAKDMLRVGGENVSAIEVESFLLQHPAVRQVQVIGVPDPRLTEVPMAVVQRKEGQRASDQEIIAFCQGRLSSFKIPRYVWFVQEFPLTGSGKVQKYKLREEAIKMLHNKKIG
jgi:fatty-acyl-CoA synthase